MPSSLFSLDFQAIRFQIHRRLSEWHMAAVLVLTGLTLLTSGRTFELEAYLVLRQIAPEPVWGWVMLGLGVARFAVLVINGTMQRGSPHLRASLAFLSALVWSVLFAGYMAFPTPILITSFVAAAVFVDGANAYRASQDAGEEDREAGARHGHLS